ncbi:alpha/beta fold hydrolase [Aureivirga sp. CE67]|uniref:alpha/beta fold hydrolase n=1 Tax=Aureivirga sp. CE67 TaxID=1788983 RepID=UPI0018CB4C39|nr:alpha/beta hydrolase [Aureivirga sp. CE67]
MSKSIRIIVLFSVLLNTLSSFGFYEKDSLSNSNAAKPFTVEIKGEGKPVFFLPGFATPGEVWEETVENLNLKRKSYLFTYAGFNGTAPIEMPWYATIKNALIQYIKDNEMSDVIIIGHSMGGSLAMDIAAELPNEISTIVLAESLPCIREVMMPNVPAKNLVYDSPYNKQMLNMSAQQFQYTATMMASNMTLKEDKKEVLKNWIMKADRETWVYGYTDILKLDQRAILHKIKSKTLILGASFPNVEIVQKNYESQYENLSNKTIKMASNSKHFLMFDQAEWFYETLNTFFEDAK